MAYDERAPTWQPDGADLRSCVFLLFRAVLRCLSRNFFCLLLALLCRACVKLWRKRRLNAKELALRFERGDNSEIFKQIPRDP